MAKVVVYIGDNGPGMLVLPADYTADLKEVSRLLGLKNFASQMNPSWRLCFQTVRWVRCRCSAACFRCQC